MRDIDILRGRPHTELKVVVLTCGSLGLELALRLSDAAGVAGVCVLIAPYQSNAGSPLDKARRLYTTDGLGGVARAVLSKVSGLNARPQAGEEQFWRQRAVAAGIPVIDVASFNDEAGVAQIAAQDADLGIIAGTYILKEPAFTAPRLGSINIHSGKAPEYRGSAPAFWEMYNGETEVGVTIHWAVSRLDAGNILRQRMFRLDPAPPGDPARYIEVYRRAVLRPNGIQLVLEAVQDIRAGRGAGTAQRVSHIKPYRLPTYEQKCELLRRVAERRRAIPNSGAA